MKLRSPFPFFLFLLPVFFIIHGLTEYFIASLINEAVILVLIFSGIAILITFLFWLILKDITKSALITFIILSINFFFGSTLDFLKNYLNNTIITRYSFIIPAILIFILAITYYFKKASKSFLTLSLYLNWLLTILIILDIATIGFKLSGYNKPNAGNVSNSLIKCDTCLKPDIYVIVADEYAGAIELKELFNFDNQLFENDLKKRGFTLIEKSISNYNATVYSMASLFNMDYIYNLKLNTVTHTDMLYCQKLIKDNSVINFLNENGYVIYNYSYFELLNKKKAVINPFYPTERALFTAQTFINRFEKNVGFNFASSEKIERVIKSQYYNNNIVDSLTRMTPLIKSGPKFVYSHLFIPHHPFYFDRYGKEIPLEKLTDSFTMNKPAYIDYLIYSNKKLLELIDHIKASSENPPVIILISDHGFRQLPADTDHKYQFMNLNAVFLPNGDYSGFYEGMSNVNEFRVILNSQFGQRLPLLKDSTIYLSE